MGASLSQVRDVSAFSRNQHAQEHQPDGESLAQGGDLLRAEVTRQHVSELHDESLKHGRGPEALVVERVHGAVTPPDREDGKREVKQRQRVESELDHAGPVGRGGLAGVNIEVNAEEDDLGADGGDKIERRSHGWFS